MGEPSNPFERAAQALRRILASGPVPVKRAYKLARDEGHTDAAVKRARDDIGAGPVQDDLGRWVLRLENEPRQDVVVQRSSAPVSASEPQPEPQAAKQEPSIPTNSGPAFPVAMVSARAGYVINRLGPKR